MERFTVSHVLAVFSVLSMILILVSIVILMLTIISYVAIRCGRPNQVKLIDYIILFYTETYTHLYM